VEIFSVLTEDERTKLTESLEEMSVEKNESIIQQGDQDAQYLYILAEGKCVAEVDGKKVKEYREGGKKGVSGWKASQGIWGGR
jgi:signal-transduction protein with cAMP-binding, CBS, and nucleotidyltransferase domain